jgi:hypoxanthine phosphoribosyltransferase
MTTTTSITTATEAASAEGRVLLAKQDPAYKATKAPVEGKVYFSYADIHDTVSKMVPQILEFNPSVIIAIGGGGFIPARMLRTELQIPILAVSLELYDDSTNTARSTVKKIQWFDEHSEVGSKVRDRKVLIVDEVDDSRTTLQYCVEEVLQTNAPSEVAVAVVHNKLKPKKGRLPEGVVYMAGANVADHWNCYPWDAAAYGNTIFEHEALAAKCTTTAEIEDGGGSNNENTTP